MKTKERLEEIETKYSTLTVSSEKNGTEYTEVDVEDLVFLIQNGFKQVERVQELERKIERYREALEFYADENNYREQELKGIVPPRPIKFKPILHDYGSIARQTLEGESNE